MVAVKIKLIICLLKCFICFKILYKCKYLYNKLCILFLKGQETWSEGLIICLTYHKQFFNHNILTYFSEVRSITVGPYLNNTSSYKFSKYCEQNIASDTFGYVRSSTNLYGGSPLLWLCELQVVVFIQGLTSCFYSNSDNLE